MKSIKSAVLFVNCKTMLLRQLLLWIDAFARLEFNLPRTVQLEGATGLGYIFQRAITPLGYAIIRNSRAAYMIPG